jgi:hypothetical protein
MTMTDDKIKQLVGRNISGLDIIHGELKNLMYECQENMADMDSNDMPYVYIEGLSDAYARMYELVDNIYAAGGK